MFIFAKDFVVQKINDDQKISLIINTNWCSFLKYVLCTNFTFLNFTVEIIVPYFTEIFHY